MPVIHEIKPESDHTIESLEIKTKKHKSEIKRTSNKPQLVEYDSFKQTSKDWATGLRTDTDFKKSPNKSNNKGLDGLGHDNFSKAMDQAFKTQMN